MRRGTLRAARSLAAALSLAVLGACNVVMTNAPVFSPADAAGAPALREGVWRQDGGDAGCKFDERQPLGTWPACANAVVIKGGALGGYRAQGDKKTWVSTPYILASGSPRVLQTYLDAEIGGVGLGPRGQQNGEAVEHDLAEAAVVLGEVIDVGG